MKLLILLVSVKLWRSVAVWGDVGDMLGRIFVLVKLQSSRGYVGVGW